MSGLAGVLSTKGKCINDLYNLLGDHEHLGQAIGGIFTRQDKGLYKEIHHIHDVPFLPRFGDLLDNLPGNMGIGITSSADVQPLKFDTCIGNFSIVVQGNFTNLQQIGDDLKKQGSNFREKTWDGKRESWHYNKAEVAGEIISKGSDLVDGIKNFWDMISGSGSINLLLMNSEGIYAARDPRGTFSLSLGVKDNAFAMVTETTGLDNLDYEILRELKAGEIVFVGANGPKTLVPGADSGKICGFLYVYTAYPEAIIQGICVEDTRDRTGAALWGNFKQLDLFGEIDFVAGIPDSGLGHAHGASHASGVPLLRPLRKKRGIRSYMYGDQTMRDYAAFHKINTIRSVIEGKRFLLVDDSLVRNTQLRWLIKKIGRCRPEEVTLGLACAPLIEICAFEESTRKREELAARRAMAAIEGKNIDDIDITPYLYPSTNKYQEMVEWIRRDVNKETEFEVVKRIIYLTTKQTVATIGLPEERICTYCWTGRM
jgi:amidophosphoribosyltransferase